MFVQRLKDFTEYNPEGEPVLDTFAEVQQRWHIWRRRYDLFLRYVPRFPQPPSTPLLPVLTHTDTCNAHISPQRTKPPHPLHRVRTPARARARARVLPPKGAHRQRLPRLALTLNDARGEEMGSVDRTFRGFGREVRLSMS